MSNNGIVQIHGKDYVTVARRVEMAHEAKSFEKLSTEVLSHDPVVVRASVTIKGKEFTGISSVSLDTAKMIEKQNPYEVAETSAVGRALGFAGIGIVEGIASADEVAKAVQAEKLATATPRPAPVATVRPATPTQQADDYQAPQEPEGSAGGHQDAPLPLDDLADLVKCRAHEELGPITMLEGTSKTKFDRNGNPKTYFYHDSTDGRRCFSRGYEQKR